MPPGLQGSDLGNNLESQKRKLEHYLDLIEQKFKKGLEYQIDNKTLKGIIDITLEITDKIKSLKSETSELQRENFNLRTKCSAALSLFEQPAFREIYIEKLNTIRPVLKALISLC
ncbi:MAG: hypothetical protein NTW69_01160 [Chloroflexi bacterium]|nr:hypothetical protein [Chloroflexota bacterium]